MAVDVRQQGCIGVAEALRRPLRDLPSDLDLFSALGGIRTPNLLIRSQMLYPLSYERRAGLDRPSHSTGPWQPAQMGSAAQPSG